MRVLQFLSALHFAPFVFLHTVENDKWINSNTWYRGKVLVGENAENVLSVSTFSVVAAFKKKPVIWEFAQYARKYHIL